MSLEEAKKISKDIKDIRVAINILVDQRQDTEDVLKRHVDAELSDYKAIVELRKIWNINDRE
jgi:hypothetical protein